MAKKFEATAISNPPANDFGEVTVVNNGDSGDGTFLDSCNGSVTAPPNTDFQCIVIKNYPGNSLPSGFPTNTASPDYGRDVFLFVSESGDCITIDSSQVSGGNWSCNGLLRASLPADPSVCVDGGGNPTPGASDCKNNLVTVAYYMGNSGGSDDVYEVTIRPWYPVDNARATAKQTRRTGAKSHSAVGGVQPIAVDGQWLVYRIDVTSTDGTRLLLGDEPLRASLLQVAAPRVQWKPELNEPTVVRTPHGNGCHHPKDGLFHMRHAGFAWYSPIAFQRVGPNVLCRYPVRSTCTNAPDLIDLDLNLDILFGVNDRFGGFGNNRGIVEVCVRVVA